MNKNSKISAVESAKIIFQLVQLAEEWSKKDELNSKLAASLIYANLAEYMADNLLFIIKFKINTKIGSSKLKINLNEVKGESTTLERAIKKLKGYDFSKKKVILPLLEKIKDSRNKLFHNLLTAKEKGLYVDALIKNINTDVRKLIQLSPGNSQIKV